MKQRFLIIIQKLFTVELNNNFDGIVHSKNDLQKIQN